MNVRVTTPFCFAIAACALALFVPAAVARAEDDDFVPPPGSLPAQRTGGASRSEGTLSVFILAPDKTIGMTSREQPVVYWYLSEDTDRPIEISINDQASKDTVAEVTLKGATKAGVHKLDLSKHLTDGKPTKLEPGKTYEVVVAVTMSETNASKDPTATCRIQRTGGADASAGEKDPAKRVAAYGKAGVWFDYLDALNAAIEAKPNDETLLQKRAKTLAAQRLIWKPDGTITEQPKREAGK
jgi:hypothetical protein